MQKKKLSANEFLRVSSYLISTTLSLPKALKPQFASWPCINQPTPTLPPYCSSARAKNSEALRFRCLETCCKNDDKITVCFLSSYSFLSFKWEIKHTLLSISKAIFTQQTQQTHQLSVSHSLHITLTVNEELHLFGRRVQGNTRSIRTTISRKEAAKAEEFCGRLLVELQTPRSHGF